MIYPKGQALELERIIEVAAEEFRLQIGKAKKHEAFREEFFQRHWDGVVAHVTIQCYTSGSEATESRVRRCVTRLWTLKKIRAELDVMAERAAPRRPSGEHFNGRDPSRPRVVYGGRRSYIGATKFG